MRYLNNGLIIGLVLLMLGFLASYSGLHFEPFAAMMIVLGAVFKELSIYLLIVGVILLLFDIFILAHYDN